MCKGLSVLVAAVCVVALTSCGEQEKKTAGERAVERMVEQQSKGKVKADLSQGKIRIKSEDGEATVSMGAAVEVPPSFPKDVPIPAGGKPIVASTHEKGAVLHVEVSGDAKAVAAAQAAQMKAQGWEEKMSMAVPEGTMRMYQKGKRTASITVIESDGKVTVQLATQGGE